MTSILDLRVFTMPLSLILRLFATAVLAGAGVTASASMSWAELRPMIAFEMSAGELEPAARSFHGQWVSLSPEERQQMRSQIRDHWRNMPAEERQKKRQEMQQRWQQRSPEDRQQIRETIRERRGGDDPVGQGPDRGRR